VFSAKVIGKLSPSADTGKLLDGDIKVPIGKVETNNQDVIFSSENHFLTISI